MLSISKFKHCIFDFDGVVIDSEKKKFKDMQDVLKKYDFNLNKNYFFKFIGKKRSLFILELNTEKLNSNLEEIMCEIHKKDYELKDYELIPDLIKFLDFLKNKNIQAHIATGSSKEFVLKILNHFNIREYFKYIITGDQVSESKPSPKVYLEMLKKINDEPAFVVEDSPAGIMSAKKAGLFVVSLIKHDKADFVVSNFSDFLKKI